MTLKETLAQLEMLGDEKTRKQNTKQGAPDNQYGVKLGDLRKIAKSIKKDHQLAMELWETGNVDARFLAILIMDVKALSADELDKLVHSMKFVRVADWLNSYVINHHPNKEELRLIWLESEVPMAARCGWSLTNERVIKNNEGLDIPSLLNRIESEAEDAASEVQWTMNFTLAGIGIHFPELRERAISIGEKLGMYRDYPVSKGCTSPFAPIWINEMVSRQKQLN
ncbi:DNA alkylation repair protein [Maribellus sediminis]|uniref:DNA alkylation repair protein n=1 Tax=Maribellus sediminis TaxID=2696285 RepID=UPI00142FD0B5|nr:DNA alkylation repair protein [Maribellus sediminis]